MKSRFEFGTVSRIIFGEGIFAEAASIALQLGRHPLLVSGLKGNALESLVENLRSHGGVVSHYEVLSEPTIHSIQNGLQVLRENSCDMLISVGGGSSIDTGKILSVMATNQGEILDYLEVIGKGKEITIPGLPLFAIPTTAGTGAEVTRNAVVGSPEHGVKVSLRSPWLLPKVALIDPQLTYSLSADITATTGLDALTQLIEPYVSVSANPLTDALCREGIHLAARSLFRAYVDGQDAEARRDMALASLFGGMALANAKLGAVHGFAGPIGGMFPIPHGAICAYLLPIVMDFNVRALQARLPESGAKQRYDEIAQWVTGSLTAKAEDGVRWVKELTRKLNIPSLTEFGVTRQSIPMLVKMAAKSSSMKGNPVPLTEAELREILERALSPDSG